MNKTKHDPNLQPAPVATRHDFEPVAVILARLFSKRTAPHRTQLRLVKPPIRP